MEFLGVLSKLFVSFYYHPVTEENQIPFTLTLTPQLTVFLHYGLSNTQRHKVVVLCNVYKSGTLSSAARECHSLN